MVGTAFCTIDAVIYANGAPNPANSCQACQTAVSTTIWVALSEGAKCDSAKVCHAGNCQSGCGIESQYYAAGASKPNWACMTCQPTASTSAWTPDETNCGCTGDFETVDSSTGLCVAKMATIPATSDHSEFSIDMTEVTQDQYDGWLSTNPKLPTSTDANCSWNTTYAEQGVVIRALERSRDIGGGPGELRPGELHAVAGVAGESDRDALEFLGRDVTLGGGHAPSDSFIF